MRKYSRLAHGCAQKVTFELFEAYATEHRRACPDNDKFLDLLPAIGEEVSRIISCPELAKTEAAGTIREAVSHKVIEWRDRVAKGNGKKRQECAVEARPKPDDAAIMSTASAPAQSKRERGRPQTIADEKKASAAKLKASGGSNREAAQVLYDTKYPSLQQTKNVPAILRNYQSKVQRDSSQKRRKASRKPNKTAG